MHATCTNSFFPSIDMLPKCNCRQIEFKPISSSKDNFLQLKEILHGQLLIN